MPGAFTERDIAETASAWAVQDLNCRQRYHAFGQGVFGDDPEYGAQTGIECYGPADVQSNGDAVDMITSTTSPSTWTATEKGSLEDPGCS